MTWSFEEKRTHIAQLVRIADALEGIHHEMKVANAARIVGTAAELNEDNARILGEQLDRLEAGNGAR